MTLRIALILLLAAIGWVHPAAAQRVIRGDCSLTVDGKTYVDIKRTCRIDMDADGSFTINVVGDGERAPRRFYFAYLSTNGDGTARVSWNGHPESLHAHAELGEDFRRKGGCWSNRRAKICAFAPRR